MEKMHLRITGFEKLEPVILFMMCICFTENYWFAISIHLVLANTIPPFKETEKCMLKII